METNTSSSSTFNSFKPPKENIVFKFVVLGDSNVGKTSILHHFIFNKCKINKFD